MKKKDKNRTDSTDPVTILPNVVIAGAATVEDSELVIKW